MKNPAVSSSCYFSATFAFNLKIVFSTQCYTKLFFIFLLAKVCQIYDMRYIPFIVEIEKKIVT